MMYSKSLFRVRMARINPWPHFKNLDPLNHLVQLHCGPILQQNQVVHLLFKPDVSLKDLHRDLAQANDIGGPLTYVFSLT